MNGATVANHLVHHLVPTPCYSNEPEGYHIITITMSSISSILPVPPSDIRYLNRTAKLPQMNAFPAVCGYTRMSRLPILLLLA